MKNEKDYKKIANASIRSAKFYQIYGGKSSENTIREFRDKD